VLTGYLFALLAMLSIGVLGVLSKLADVHGCKPLNTSLVLFGGSALIMAGHVVVGQHESLVPPLAVGATAVVFGGLAILAFWVFLYGLQFGKITSSWIFMNLSAIVPATLSVLIYREYVSAAKAVVLVLVVVSILLLWKDKQQENETASDTAREEPNRGNVNIWITAMLAAFLLNGTCPFGLRVLAGWGLADRFTAVYLVYWYLAGFVFGLAGLVSARHRLSAANLIIGLVMAVASVGGQFFMGAALSRGVPGSVVYMLGMGASLCIVVLGGVLFFGERVGPYAKWGIATGLMSAILLGLG
jgi:drug/metabolite transporter (DMT)-like permease